MKKLVSIITLLFVLACLPIGVMAQDSQDESSIPNNTITAETEGAIPNMTKGADEEDLNPVERTIIVRDAIRSNASTGIGSNSGN